MIWDCLQDNVNWTTLSKLGFDENPHCCLCEEEPDTSKYLLCKRACFLWLGVRHWYESWIICPALVNISRTYASARKNQTIIRIYVFYYEKQSLRIPNNTLFVELGFQILFTINLIVEDKTIQFLLNTSAELILTGAHRIRSKTSKIRLL